MKKFRIVALVLVLIIVTTCIFALSACDDAKRTDLFEQTKSFTIDNSTTNFMGLIYGGVLTTIENIAVDMDQTYFEFESNGKMHAQIQTKAGLLGNLGSLLGMFGMGGGSLEDMLGSVDISGGLKAYVEPMFPGFTAKLENGDLQGALSLLTSSLGFNLVGFDYDDEALQEAVRYIGEQKKLPGNLLDIIPQDIVLTLTLDTEYRIVDVVGADNTHYQAIYIGYDVKENPNTQPFAVFTVGENNGKTTLVLRIEFININIGLIER